MVEAQNIRLHLVTKERLEKHGKFGETHNDIIIRLLDEYEKNIQVQDIPK